MMSGVVYASVNLLIYEPNVIIGIPHFLFCSTSFLKGSLFWNFVLVLGILLSFKLFEYVVKPLSQLYV